jgi:hypothetical protein
MATNICKYKDVLGIPGKGIHKYRLFGIAIVDLLLTLLLSAIIYWMTGINFIVVLLLLLLLSIVLHYLFCVNTVTNNYLFSS